MKGTTPLLFYVIVLSIAIGTPSLHAKSTTGNDENEDFKQQVVSRHANLVGLASHARDTLNPSDLKADPLKQGGAPQPGEASAQSTNENVIKDHDASKKNVRRHANLVGLATHLRDQVVQDENVKQKLLRIRQIPNIRSTDDEPKKKVRKEANLVGVTSQLRKQAFMNVDNSQKEIRIRQASEDNSTDNKAKKNVRRQVNMVGLATRLRDQPSPAEIPKLEREEMEKMQMTRQLPESNLVGVASLSKNQDRILDAVGVSNEMAPKVRQVSEINSTYIDDKNNNKTRRHVNLVGLATYSRDNVIQPVRVPKSGRHDNHHKPQQISDINVIKSGNENVDDTQRQADLLGQMTHLRDLAEGQSKVADFFTNDKYLRIRQISETNWTNRDSDPKNSTRRHINLVGLATRLKDLEDGLSKGDTLTVPVNDKQQKTRGISEANSSVNENSNKTRRHVNLVGLATRLRKKWIVDETDDDAEPVNATKRSPEVTTPKTAEGTSLDQSNISKTISRREKHQTGTVNLDITPGVDQSIVPQPNDNDPAKVNVRRHANLVGMATRARDKSAHKGGIRWVPLEVVKTNLEERDVKPLTRQIFNSNGKHRRVQKHPPALVNRRCLEGVNCNKRRIETIVGTASPLNENPLSPKRTNRRQTNMVGLASRRREYPMGSDPVIEADQDDEKKMQKTRQIFNGDAEDEWLAHAQESEIPKEPSAGAEKRQGAYDMDSAVITTSGPAVAPQLEDDNAHETGTRDTSEIEYDSAYSMAKEALAVTENNENNDEEVTSQSPENTKTGKCFTSFTIASTDIGIDFNKVPYRERYLWDKLDAPCHSFSVRIPDETEERSQIMLCIYRPTLEFPDETKLSIPSVSSPLSDEGSNSQQPQQRVVGYVMHTGVSSVFGRVVDRQFFGEVSIYTEHSPDPIVFVVEEIELLNRLMRSSQKSIAHMLMVMHGKGNEQEKPQLQYNAVVTKGASLIDFMIFSNPTEINRNSFILLSTSHNSYICPGEAVMIIDDSGEVILESDKSQISINPDGSIHMFTDDKVYTFRPHGRTIVSQGMEVRTLQEHEGSVSISAFTQNSIYDCVLPTPAFQQKRKGGYLCKVCVAVDELFYRFYIANQTGDPEKAGLYISRIIDRVSWIFRSFDLDNDKRPDNVGLEYDAQSVRWAYPDNNKEDLSEQDVEVLFQSLGAYDFSDCCLGIGFTMKNLPNNMYASRPVETSPSKTKLINPSGICGGKTGRIPNNLIIISGNNKLGNYELLTEKQLIYLVAHQVASVFGALTDGNGGEDSCDQFVDDHKTTRHYLMWPDVIRNTTLKEQTLSPCSKRDIMKTLQSCKSSCFDINKHPFCGNGIVEEGEECDCGSEFSCRLQTCCYSRIGKHPCRKSGIGCRADDSASKSLLFEKGLLILIFGLLAASMHS